MTVQELIDIQLFQLKNAGDDLERDITVPFCCDLLSVAMGQAPSGSAWVTIMSNLNTLAVASLADVACVILAEGVELDGAVKETANAKGINILTAHMPAYETAMALASRL